MYDIASKSAVQILDPSTHLWGALLPQDQRFLQPDTGATLIHSPSSAKNLQFKLLPRVSWENLIYVRLFFVYLGLWSHDLLFPSEKHNSTASVKETMCKVNDHLCVLCQDPLTINWIKLVEQCLQMNWRSHVYAHLLFRVVVPWHRALPRAVLQASHSIFINPASMKKQVWLSWSPSFLAKKSRKHHTYIYIWLENRSA